MVTGRGRINSAIYADKFERDVRRIKDILVKERISRQIEKIAENPVVRKPLRYGLKGEWTIRVKPYRIIYAVQDDKLILLRFEYREKKFTKIKKNRSLDDMI